MKKNQAGARKAGPKSTQGVRIIAGEWRGRRLEVLESDGLRPTGSRVREMLFNWLQAFTMGSTALDLFSGSGVLGFEAASRAAKSVTLIEKNPKIASKIQQNVEAFKAENIQVFQQSAAYFLSQTEQSFNLIFLDPPFSENLHQLMIDLIDENSVLEKAGHLYVEMPKKSPLPQLPKHWAVVKDKKVSDVRCLLIQNL